MTEPYWKSVFPNDGVVWNYYDWSNWRAAADYASQAAQKPRPVYSGTKDGPKTPTGECVYDTIIVIGFSNGGDRVFDVVRRLKQNNIKVDLAITVDPVPSGTFRGAKEFLLDLLPGRSGPSYRATSNATNWLNYYQRSSRFVRGWPVAGAENINLTDSYPQLSILKDPLGLEPHIEAVQHARTDGTVYAATSAVPRFRDNWQEN